MKNKSVRELFGNIAERAAKAGYPDADKLADCTPKEIELRLTAFAAAQNRRMAELDAAAWMAARYTAIALLAPRKFSHSPNTFRARTAMTDAEMRGIFENLAQNDRKERENEHD